MYITGITVRLIQTSVADTCCLMIMMVIVGDQSVTRSLFFIASQLLCNMSHG